jgi:NADH:ubiquinone oxidoreductase subunit C
MSWFDYLGKVYRISKRCFFIEVKAGNLMEALEKVREKTERISSITGTDTGKGFEITYHFVIGDEVINVKASLKKPQVRSISEIFPGALMLERELYETLGIEPVGHGNLKPLILDPEHSPKKPALKEGRK